MLAHMTAWLRLAGDDRAVTALEYGLIAGAIVAVIAATVIGMGQAVETTFQTVTTGL